MDINYVLNLITSGMIGGLIVYAIQNWRGTDYEIHLSMTSEHGKEQCEYIDFEIFKEKFLISDMKPEFKYKYSFFNRDDYKVDTQFHASIISFNNTRYKAVNHTELKKIKKFCKQIWIAEKSKQM